MYAGVIIMEDHFIRKTTTFARNKKESVLSPSLNNIREVYDMCAQSDMCVNKIRVCRKRMWSDNVSNMELTFFYNATSSRWNSLLFFLDVIVDVNQAIFHM